jgi:hypothetical protein
MRSTKSKSTPVRFAPESELSSVKPIQPATAHPKSIKSVNQVRPHLPILNVGSPPRSYPKIAPMQTMSLAEKADYNAIMQRSAQVKLPPFDLAAAEGNVGLLKILEPTGTSGKALDLAAINEHFGSMEWLHEHDYPPTPLIYLSVAKQGRIRVLNWLWSRGYRGEMKITSLDKISRDLRVFQWLSDRGFEISPLIALDVVRVGFIQGLMWLHYHGYLNKLTREQLNQVFEIAARHNQLEIIKFLHAFEYQGELNLIDVAVESDSAEMLTWLNKNDYAGSQLMANYATSAGKLNSLNWIKNHDPDDITDDLMNLAIEKGYLNIAKWLHKQSMPLDNRSFTLAVENGFDLIVEWLISIGTVGNTSDIILAIRGGHLNVLKILWANDYEFDEAHIFMVAAYNYVNILDWMNQEGMETNDEIYLDVLKHDAVDAAKWLYMHGYDLPEDTVSIVNKYHANKILSWLSSIE